WPNGASEFSSVPILIAGTLLMGHLDPPHEGLWFQPGSLAGKTLLDLGEPEGAMPVAVEPSNGFFSIPGLRPGSYILRYVREADGEESEDIVLEALAWEFVVEPDTGFEIQLSDVIKLEIEEE